MMSILSNQPNGTSSGYQRKQSIRRAPHIHTLAKNPRPRGCVKIRGATSDWRIRIGSYRVIYEVDDRAKVVRVMHVRKREKAY